MKPGDMVGVKWANGWVTGTVKETTLTGAHVEVYARTGKPFTIWRLRKNIKEY